MRLEFTVQNKTLTCRHSGPLVGDTAGHYTVSVSFDAEWDGLTKVLAFRNGADTASLLYTGECDLPPQVSGPGELEVACHGYRNADDEVAVVRTFRMTRPLRILASAPMAEDSGSEWTPTLFSQVVAAAGQAVEASGQAAQAVKELQQQKASGAFDGGFYIPSAGLADRETMQLEFTGSEASMQPLQFRIPLPKAEAAAVDSIPVPDTAAVGQTIQVAAVAETGRPTAWEAVDFPSGGTAEKQWTVLQEAELTEDASIRITDFDRTLSEYLFHLIIPKVSAAINTGNSSFLGARAFTYSQNFGSTGYAAHYSYHARMISNSRMLFVRYQTMCNSTDFNNDYVISPQTPYGSVVGCNVNSVNGIELRGTFPAGTKFRLEGR